jgi:microcystin-dependent protein|tara:strand:+ start:1206 stop:1772 length:567 start_codon:yes stop_codon:yes gene_type:complete
MSNYEATKYNFNAGNLTGIEGIPTATIVPWTDSSIPSGFLECNGAAVSRTTYSALFAIVGTTYGAGDGSSTFNVPDISDKTAIGKSGTKALASTGGAENVASTGNIAGSTGAHALTTPEMAAHTHPQGGGSINSPSNTPPGPKAGATPSNTGSAGGGDTHSHNMSATFTGDSTSVVQPYLTLIYIIKT